MSFQEDTKNVSPPDTIADEMNNKCIESELINEKSVEKELISNGNEEPDNLGNGIDDKNTNSNSEEPCLDSYDQIKNSDEQVTNPDYNETNPTEHLMNSSQQISNEKSDKQLSNSDEQPENSDETNSECLNIEKQPDEETNENMINVPVENESTTANVGEQASDKSIEPSSESNEESRKCDDKIEPVASSPNAEDGKLDDAKKNDETQQTNEQILLDETTNVTEITPSIETESTESTSLVVDEQEKQHSDEMKTIENNQEFLTLNSNDHQQHQTEQLNPESVMLDALSASQEHTQLFVQEQDEINQALNQPQIILQQTQNPETGEVLFVLQGENGEQIALPPEAISSGFVQIRDSEGNEQIIALALSNDDGTSNSLIGGQNLLQTSSEANDLGEQVFLQTQQPLEVSADIINTLGAANIPIPPQQLTPTTASTNVVQSLETPRVSTQETTMTTTEMNTVQKDNTSTILTGSQITSDDMLEKQLIINEGSSKSEDNSTSIDLIQNSINNATLENMVSNATLLTGVEGSSDQNFVIMTGDNQLTTLGNLSNQIAAVPGQTFLIETTDGLLQCTMDANGALQLIQNSGDLTASSQQNHYITVQNDLQENQIIETIGENGQPLTFAVSSTNDEIQLLPVNNLQQQSSLLDLKNSNLTTAKSPSASPTKSSSKTNQLIPPTKKTNISPVYLIGESTSLNKTIMNPTLNTTKKQNVSIIQNISHQPHFTHQQQIITTNNNQSSHRKRIQQQHNQPQKSYLTIPASSNAKSYSSASTTANNLLLSSASNSNEDSKRTYANYTHHQLQASSHASSIHVNKQDPNPLSSSRRTYSRKNIVWLNPVQASSNSSTLTAISSNNLTENKEDKLQSKIESNEKKSVTITPVKDHLSSSDRSSNDPNLKSSPSQSIKKGTITISTIIDSTKQPNRTSNVCNQVKIVPSEAQSRLLKNLPSSQSSDQVNEFIADDDDDLRSFDDDCSDKMEIEIRPTRENKKTSSDCEDKPTKRLKRSSFATEVEEKSEVEILTSDNETSSTTAAADDEEKNKIELINSIINEPVIDDQSLSPIKHESGRRKSPIKTLKDCETNFDEETKEIQIDDENDVNEFDSEITSKSINEPIVEKAKPKEIVFRCDQPTRTRSRNASKSEEEPANTKLRIETKCESKPEEESTTRTRASTKSDSKFEEESITRTRASIRSEIRSEEEPITRTRASTKSEIRSEEELANAKLKIASKSESKPEEESTTKTRASTRVENKSEEESTKRSRTSSKSEVESSKRSRSESKTEEESIKSADDAKKTRRSCRLPKTVIEQPVEKEEKVVNEPEKLVAKEVKISKKPEKVDEPALKSDEETTSTHRLRRGRSIGKKREGEETSGSHNVDASNEKVAKTDIKSTTKESRQSKSVEPEGKRLDEDSVRFDLLFKSQPVQEEKQLPKSSKHKKAEALKLTSDNEMEVELATNRRNSRAFKTNDMYVIETLVKNNEPSIKTIESSAESNEPSVDSTPTANKKRSLRSTSSFVKVENSSTSKLLASSKVSTAKSSKTNDRRQTISSVRDLRDEKEFYDEKLSSCEVHIRYQSSKSSNSSGNHMCQKCGFSTNRINLLVQHHKSDCQTIKSQLNFWHDEIKRVQQQQQANKSPASKKKRILDSSGKWEFNDLDSNDNNRSEYSKRESSDDDEMLSSDREDSDRMYRLKEGIEIQSVVWVELRDANVKWPALVQQIKLGTNQVLVHLIDAPADRLCSSKELYSIDEVISFDDANQNIKFLDETKSQYDDSIVKVVQKAEDYTRKKLLGENLEPGKLLGDQQADSKQGKCFKINYASLLQYIKSGRVEAHLLGIYKESIKSDLHTAFKSGVKSAISSTSNHYGPIDNEDDRENLFNYCLDLFKSNFRIENDDFDVVDYLMDVWVPSALIKGINRLYRITMEEAENMFNCKTEETVIRN